MEHRFVLVVAVFCLLHSQGIDSQLWGNPNSNGIGLALLDSVAAALNESTWALTNSSQWPANCEACHTGTEQENTFDYIVIGAGSAGSIVASRLSEDPNVSVLLLEAGELPTLESEIYALSGTLHTDPRYMYMDEAEPNPKCCQAMKSPHGCCWWHARMFGGTGAVNGNIYVPGSAANFQGWRWRLGLKGWDWPQVQSAYSRLQAQLQLHYFPVEPLNLRLATLIYAAATELGVPRMQQPLLSGSSFGYTHHVPATINQGQRASSARKYLARLDVLQRTNLHVLRGAEAQRLLFSVNEKRARGVSYALRARNTTFNAWARRELIVSAGTLNSAKLLLLSGIGPAVPLQKLGIKSRVSLPGVGRNLHDHGMLPLFLRFTGSCAVNSSTAQGRSSFEPASVAEYLLQEHRGPLAASFSMMGFINSSAPHSRTGQPDLHVVAHTLLPRGSTGSFGYLGFRTELVQAQQAALQETDLLQIMGSLLLPQSRGNVQLRSADPQQPPLIWNNYGAAAADRATLLRFVRYVQRLTHTYAFRRCGLQLWIPPLPECDALQRDSDDYWLCHIRFMYIGAWHAVGTCRMATSGDPLGVVDERLRVRGVKGLRVIDASVMPEVTAGNTNAPTMMIAEQGARMIREDYAENFQKDLYENLEKDIQQDLLKELPVTAELPEELGENYENEPNEIAV